MRVSFGSSPSQSRTVDLHFYEVEQDQKLALLHRLLDSEPGSFLVFARTKHGAEQGWRRTSHAAV